MQALMWMSVAWTLTVGQADGELFVAQPLTAEGSFTTGIEGPACDQAGVLYVVNLKERGDIAAVAADGTAEVFVKLPEKSVGNGIRSSNASNFVQGIAFLLLRRCSQ